MKPRRLLAPRRPMTPRWQPRVAALGGADALAGAGPGMPAAPFLVALLVAIGAWLGVAGLAPLPTVASCVEPSAPADSVRFGRIVFVGNVVKVANDGRWVQVQVEERWRGAEDLPDVVEVRGGPEAGTATSLDRPYLAGRYLFVVEAGPGYLVDDACSGTVRWSDDLAALRPAGVAPAATGATATEPILGGIDLLPVVALLLALAIAVGSYVLILRSRKRPPDWMR